MVMKESRPPHTTAWRFCTSCLVTLLCWALWLVLGGALAWQGYITAVKDLSVPDFILRRIETSLAAENFSVRFGRAHFDAQGGILLENVQLHSRAFEEPLLTGDFVYLRKSIWSILAGHRLPDLVRIEGASVQLPAMLSPSGTAEQLLSDVNAELRFPGGLWSVDRLTGRIGNLPLSITGSAARPRGTSGSPLSATEILTRYRDFARQAVLALPELQAVENPHVEIACTPRETGGMNLTLNFFADAVHRPGNYPVEVGAVFVSGQWWWDGLKPAPLQLQVTARDVTGEQGSATQISSVLTVEPDAGPTRFSRVHGQVAATELQALGEQFDAPVVTGSYWPGPQRLELAAVFQSLGQVLALEGAANLRQKSALVHFSGAVPPPLVTGLLTRYGPKLEPYFRFGDPVVLEARMKLADDWKFDGIWSHAEVGRLDSHGVKITSARGQVDVDADRNFLAHDAYVVAGENEARGSYWMNFRSMDYRFLLTGRLRPPDISGWFRGSWWPDFWSNFAFPSAAPRADVDVLGCWKEARRTIYFGSADTGRADVLHTDFEKAHALIFLRPQFTHALDLVVERADGTQRVSGWFKRTAKPGPLAASELSFDLTGNLDAQSLQTLGGATAVNLLAPFKLNHPPQLHLWGHTAKNDEEAQSDIQFTGEVIGPLKYNNFPLEQLRVNGSTTGDTLQLDQIDLSIAGGRGRGRATLKGPAKNRSLRFDFAMKEADLARSIRAVEEFEAARTGVQAESMTESKFIKRASGGKLDLDLSAQCNPDHPTNLNGTGTMQLTGAELGEIHLFGLLSQVLSFSSLKLDAARTSFQIADGHVYFPDVRITGKSALIEAKGNYLIDTKSLDFTASLKPYEETHNPFTAIAALVMNPLTSMFQLSLTGPLANPKWTVGLGSAPPKPAEPEKKPDTPVPPETVQP
jgi:hypothetical protein